MPEALPIPASVLDAYRTGRMTPEDSADLEAVVASGAYAVPAGFQMRATAAPPPAVTPAPGAVPRAPAAPMDESVQLYFDRGAAPSTTTPSPHQEPKAQRDVDDLPEWMSMPEVGPLAIALSSGAGVDELAQMVKSLSPKIKADRIGDRVVFTSGNGRKYLLRPGAQEGDVLRGLIATGIAMAGGKAGTAVASRLVPALAGPGLAASMASAAVDGMAGAATHEAMQSQGGGRAELAPVVTAGMGAMAVPAAGRVVRGLGSAAFGEGIPAAIADSQAVDVVGETLAKAARGDAAAVADFAAQARPDPKALAAVKRLDMTDLVDVDHLSPNPGVQTVVQAAKASDAAAKAAERSSVEEMGDRAKQLVAAIAGSDASAINESVKSALGKQVDESKVLYKGLYETYDTMTPRNVPAPAPGTLALAKKAATDISTRDAKEVPKGLIGLVKKLTPENGADPTRAMVELQRKEIARGLSGKGKLKELDPGVLKGLLESIDGELQAIAEARGVGAERTKAVEAFKAHLQFKEDAIAALGSKAGDELAGSIIPGLSQSSAGLGVGIPDRFIGLVTAVPLELRSRVADSAVASALIKNGKAEIPQFLDWFEGLKRNTASHAAYEKYVRPEMRALFQDIYDGLKPVMDVTKRGARGVRAQEVLPEGRGAVGLAKRILGVATGAALDTAASSANIPIPGGMLSTISLLLMSQLSGKPTPMVEAALDFLKSGAGRAAFNAAESAQPVSRGLLEKIASSPAGRRFAAEAGMRPEGLAKLIESTVVGGGAAASSVQKGGYLSKPVGKE